MAFLYAMVAVILEWVNSSGVLGQLYSGDYKKKAGAYKAKENYLLSGLVYCGECGHAMSGNLRFGGRNKTRYASYKCNYRENNKACRNKEIRKEYLEAFVLDELKKRLFNKKSLPRLVSMLNDFRAKKAKEQSQDMTAIQAQLADVNRKIQNIVNAITEGYMQAEFKTKMAELEKQKAQLATQIDVRLPSQTSAPVTEKVLQQVIKQFDHFVTTKNVPECKRMVQSYVDKILVYIDHVEVVFKITLPAEEADVFTFEFSEQMQEIRQNYSKLI